MIHPPVRRKQLTNEEKKDKLKSVLLKSYSEERMLTDTVTPLYSTLQQCLIPIQNCERLINSGRLNVLHHSRLRRKRCYHTMMHGEAIFYICLDLSDRIKSLSASLCDNIAYGISGSDLYFDKLQTELFVIFFEWLS